MAAFNGFGRLARRALILAAAWLVSWWLVLDSWSYGLSPFDPATGRERGCYTDIETWLGFLQPSAWIRPAEQIVGTVLFLGIPLMIAVWLVRLLLRRKMAGPRMKSIHASNSGGIDP
jgi:hypothetical protein